MLNLLAEENKHLNMRSWVCAITFAYLHNNQENRRWLINLDFVFWQSNIIWTMRDVRRPWHIGLFLMRLISVINKDRIIFASQEYNSYSWGFNYLFISSSNIRLQSGWYDLLLSHDNQNKICMQSMVTIYYFYMIINLFFMLFFL
jgi:hypothetical protein